VGIVSLSFFGSPDLRFFGPFAFPFAVCPFAVLPLPLLPLFRQNP